MMMDGDVGVSVFFIAENLTVAPDHAHPEHLRSLQSIDLTNWELVIVELSGPQLRCSRVVNGRKVRPSSRRLAFRPRRITG